LSIKRNPENGLVRQDRTVFGAVKMRKKYKAFSVSCPLFIGTARLRAGPYGPVSSVLGELSMKRKKLLVVLTVLLGVSLFLLGCPTSDSDLSTEEAKAIALAEIVGGDVSLATQTVTLKGDFKVDEAGSSLSVPEGVTLVVPAGKKLTLTVKVKDGIVTDEGSLIVAGTVKVAGEVTVLKLDNGLPKITFTGKGKVELANKAVVKYVKEGTTETFIAGDDKGFYQWGSGAPKVTLTTNKLELSGGTVIVADDTSIEPGTTVLVKDTATLSVASGKTFTVASTSSVIKGTLTIDGKVNGVAAGAQLKVETDGTVDGDKATIFYPTSGTTAGTFTANKTYKWEVGTTSGQIGAGWREQS
jgi:hypothetical protein